jgi:3-phenylpropionate/trans-cinnamate dioxygenase ferredoxin subunit
MSNWSSVCLLSELPVGSIRKYEIDGEDIAVVNTAEGVFAVDDTCTHAEISLSEGELQGCKLECWMHGAAFDVRTGEALTPPAITPLKTYPVEIVGDGDSAEIRIKVSE